jgi:uncharacterized membrane-anchored protein
MNKLLKFSIVVGAQAVLILVIILFKVAILSGGTTVQLRVQPVDPRDLLRGDYMVLSYEGVSQLDKSYFNYQNIKVGDVVYVPLRSYGDYWRAQYGISKKLPTDPGRYVYIKGSVEGVSNYEMDLVYNIEEYFIPEGVGQVTSWNAIQNVVTVDVVVAENGNAVLKQLLVDGQNWP